MRRSDIAAGGTFPDYELADHTQTIRKLSELQGDDPLILTLARGHYCPKDHQQHLQLAAFYPQIAVAYTRIVTISTDHHHTSQEFRASIGAEWPFLSDPGRRAGGACPGSRACRLLKPLRGCPAGRHPRRVAAAPRKAIQTRWRVVRSGLSPHLRGRPSGSGKLWRSTSGRFSERASSFFLGS